jgi:hypothetical protein
MTDLRSNVNDPSGKSKPEPTKQAADGSLPPTVAPKNQAVKSGRLPLFRK